MKIYACEVVPLPVSHEMQTKVHDYNEHLEKWCATNGVTVIKTVPTFKLGTGDIDDLCFETATDKAPLLLNRLGAVKLLGTLNNQCANFHLCSSWNTIKRNCITSHNLTQNKYTNSTHQKPTPPQTSVASHTPPSTLKHQTSTITTTQGGFSQHPSSVVHLPSHTTT